MRKKYFYCNCKLPMNLQFFADGGDGGDGGDGAGAGGNGDGAGAESFDDFLQKDGNQAEFDRRMQKAIEKAVNKGRKSRVPAEEERKGAFRQRGSGHKKGTDGGGKKHAGRKESSGRPCWDPGLFRCRCLQQIYSGGGESIPESSRGCGK